MGKIKELVDQIIEDGILTSAEHEEFMQAVHADGEIDQEESEQISRIFQLIQEGKLKVVNDERESAEAKRKAELQKKLSDWD